MSASRHQPLFNRRYLIALAWILPAVILLLHLSARPDRPLASIGWSGTEQLYFLSVDRDGYRLDLILPEELALNDADWREQQLARARLKARLAAPAVTSWLEQQGWQLAQSDAGGYRALQFEMKHPPATADRERLLALLTEAPALNGDALRSELDARRYLARQEAQTLLLAALGERLPRQQGSAPPPRWSLTGPDPGLTADPAPTGNHSTQSSDWHPGRLSIPPESARTDTGWALLGEPLPAPDSGAALAQQRFVADAVARLLPQVTPAQADYRWRWQPLAAGGYRALLLHNWPQEAGPVGERLADALDENGLGTIRDDLLARFDRLLAESPQQWLNLLALYRLPLDSHAPFRDTLQQLSLGEARSLLTQTLSPEQSLHIRLTPDSPDN